MVKNPSANAGDAVLIPESGRSPGEGNGNPFQYSCLRNPTDRGAWRATVHGVAELDMTEQISNDNMGILGFKIHWAILLRLVIKILKSSQSLGVCLLGLYCGRYK